MTDLSIFAQLSQVLTDWVPEAASIAIADRERYVVYRPGTHDLRIEPGELVRKGSVAEQVFRQQGRVELDVDSSLFGVPYHGLGYPLRTQAGVESALTVILPPGQPTQMQSLTFVMGQAGAMWRPIPLQDIAYLESYQKKTWVHTKDGVLTTDHTLQSLEKRLPSAYFIRIHRAFIINISWIDFIERDDRSSLVITLKDGAGTRLTVSQTYVRQVRRSLGF
ncbi:LytTR family DNA-binding domain-containing protein [Alicyclobacillus fastidiosus]|uniref:LytTR family DNA-binding domain-containing protein n=1 Tax=Alicyclobacillus fastidiosus TaxID=392011 RepID=A0ABV5AGD2_9BACL|nr:LytTR family DNA-binding domain-containing protein [Alicyclobacillus fastidiosus]WEH08939.1 LytTR family DNA-binding domain-containing protein [Alicyclobacillus fastidiosus]